MQSMSLVLWIFEYQIARHQRRNAVDVMLNEVHAVSGDTFLNLAPMK